MNVENLSGGDTPDVNIQINGDAVENNYWRMYWTAGGYHTAASYGMGLIKDNETAMYNITAMIDNNGRTKIWADVMGGGKAAGTNYDVKNLIEHYNNVQTRITSIKLISERAGSLTGTVVLWGLPV